MHWIMFAMGLSTVTYGGCPEGLSAYQKSLYQLLKSDCVVCHEPSGEGPTFLPGEVEESYKEVSALVDFEKLASSTLVVKGGDQHCIAYGGFCNTLPEDLVKKAKKWWEQGEHLCKAQR